MSAGMPSSRLHALASQIERNLRLTQHIRTEAWGDLQSANFIFQRRLDPEVAAVYHMDWTHDELTQVPIHDESGHVLGHVPIYGVMTVGNFFRMIQDELSVTHRFELKLCRLGWEITIGRPHYNMDAEFGIEPDKYRVVLIPMVDGRSNAGRFERVHTQ